MWDITLIGGFICGVGVILMYIGIKVNKRTLTPPKLSLAEEEFPKVFEALKNLDTYLSDKIEFSKIETAKRISKFERGIYYSRDCSKTLWFELTKDRNELLFLFKQNLKERLLPTINRGKEEEIKRVYHIIEKIAEYLLNPTASVLEDLNELMSELPTYKKEKVSLIWFFERYPKSRHAISELLIVLICVVTYYIGVKFLNISTGEAYIAATALLGVLTTGYIAIIAIKR